MEAAGAKKLAFERLEKGGGGSQESSIPSASRRLSTVSVGVKHIIALRLLFETENVQRTVKETITYESLGEG